jgi:hypothetical protein
MTNDQILSPDMWQSKPWWCQPWTIILTGVLIVFSSWLVLHILWITVPLAVLIGAWWLYFLVLVPRMLRQLAAADAAQSSSSTK